MTLSIVAKDNISGDFGVCGYTDIAGYGSLVPHVSLNGAVATQAYVNVDNGLKMMELLDINQDSNKSGERIFRLTYMSVIDFRISVPVAKTTPLLSPRTSCIYHDKNNIPIAL